MRFSVRIKESPTLEHVYEFEVYPKYLCCTSHWYSRRSGLDDIWGYDQEEHFSSVRNLELSEIYKEYGDDWDNEYYYNNEAGHKYSKVYAKFNPVLNKTKDGLTYLTGSSYRGILKEYPPPMDWEEFKNLVKIEAKSCIEKMEIKQGPVDVLPAPV